MRLSASEQVGLVIFFGSLVVGIFGIWLMKVRWAWGFSVCCMVLALWGFGGMTEYSVRKEYCDQMGANLTRRGKQLWCTNGMKPPPVDWTRDWGHLLGF